MSGAPGRIRTSDPLVDFCDLARSTPMPSHNMSLPVMTNCLVESDQLGQPAPKLHQIHCVAAEYPDQGVEGASPLRSLVATQDVYPLCVLIDLHPEQNLVADGEISQQVLFESTSRTEVASRGNVTVWAFNHNRVWRQSAVATDLQ